MRENADQYNSEYEHFLRSNSNEPILRERRYRRMDTQSWINGTLRQSQMSNMTETYTAYLRITKIFELFSS